MEQKRRSNLPVALGITAAIVGGVVLAGHLTSDSLETRVATTPTLQTSEVIMEQPTREEYLVMSGDTAYNICQDYGITFGELKEYNPVVEDWNKLEVGQQLYVRGVQDE